LEERIYTVHVISQTNTLIPITKYSTVCMPLSKQLSCDVLSIQKTLGGGRFLIFASVYQQ